MAKCMIAQMKPNIFNPFDPISIIRVFKNFKLACDTNGVHESPVMWLFHLFMNMTASVVENVRLIAERTDKKYHW